MKAAEFKSLCSASDVHHLVFDQTLFPHQLTLVVVMQ